MARRVIIATDDAGRPMDAVVIDFANYRIWNGGVPGHTGNTRTFRVRALFLVASVAVRFVATEAAIDYVWADDEDGGPLSAKSHMCWIINQNADFFDRCGIKVSSCWGRGYIAEPKQTERAAA